MGMCALLIGRKVADACHDSFGSFILLCDQWVFMLIFIEIYNTLELPTIFVFLKNKICCHIKLNIHINNLIIKILLISC